MSNNKKLIRNSTAEFLNFTAQDGFFESNFDKVIFKELEGDKYDK